MKREDIEKLLPLGRSYLWLDEVVKLGESEIHARKYLDPDLEIFRAHYIGFPLFPGALQCEAAFQAAAVLIAQRYTPTEGRVPVIARVRNVKFRRMVRPGETMDIKVELLSEVSGIVSLRGRITVDGKTATRLEFSATEATPPPSTAPGTN